MTQLKFLSPQAPGSEEARLNATSWSRVSAQQSSKMFIIRIWFEERKRVILVRRKGRSSMIFSEQRQKEKQFKFCIRQVVFDKLRFVHQGWVSTRSKTKMHDEGNSNITEGVPSKLIVRLQRCKSLWISATVFILQQSFRADWNSTQPVSASNHCCSDRNRTRIVTTDDRIFHFFSIRSAELKRFLLVLH